MGPVTAQVALSAIVLALVMAIPLALISAARDGSTSAAAISTGVQVAQTIPVFVTGLLGIWVFAEWLDLLPAAGWTRPTVSVTGNLERSLLPVTTLAFAEVAAFARVLRADLVEVLRQDYIQAARVRGLSPTRIMLRHALRPGSFGLMTLIGLNTTNLLGGAVIIEKVFALPGLGAELFDAILARDLYLILGITLYIGVITITIGAIVDVVYQWLDPRVSPELARLRPGRGPRRAPGGANMAG